MTYVTFMMTLICIFVLFAGIEILDMIGCDVVNAIEKKMVKFGLFLEKKGLL